MVRKCLRDTESQQSLEVDEENGQQVKGDDPSSLFTEEAHMKCCVQPWVSQGKRDMGMGSAQQQP